MYMHIHTCVQVEPTIYKSIPYWGQTTNGDLWFPYIIILLRALIPNHWDDNYQSGPGLGPRPQAPGLGATGLGPLAPADHGRHLKRTIYTCDWHMEACSIQACVYIYMIRLDLLPTTVWALLRVETSNFCTTSGRWGRAPNKQPS